jgi:hypothetical protein
VIGPHLLEPREELFHVVGSSFAHYCRDEAVLLLNCCVLNLSLPDDVFTKLDDIADGVSDHHRYHRWFGACSRHIQSRKLDLPSYKRQRQM